MGGTGAVIGGISGGVIAWNKNKPPNATVTEEFNKFIATIQDYFTDTFSSNATVTKKINNITATDDDYFPAE
jgi:oligoendopeptidase F